LTYGRFGQLRGHRPAAIIFAMRRGALWLVVLGLGVAGAAGGTRTDELGPTLDPNRLTQLPTEGLAAPAGSSLVVATTRGRVVGHLERFSLDGDSALDQLAPGAGPLLVRDGAGKRWELRRGRLVATARELRLVGGRYLRKIGARWTYGGRRVAFVSERRDLLTFFERSRARVLDLRGGRTIAFPRGCRAAARWTPGRLVVLCGYPFGAGPSRVLRGDPSGRLVRFLGPAATAVRPAGWWTSAFVSPDGRRLLLQWSGECEIPVAFFAPAHHARSLPVTGQRSLARAPESVALGWTRGGRAVVELPKGGCGSGTRRAGVYAIEPISGAVTYLYRHARLWRSLG